MHRILTAAEMREADCATIEDRGVPGLLLMENAASAVTRELLERYQAVDQGNILVLCGKGNNGGDGLAVARQLLLQKPDINMQVVLLADPGQLTGDTAVNWQALVAQDFHPETSATPEEWRALRNRLIAPSLIVDAILGTGVHGAPHGIAAKVIADVNRLYRNASVVAVDMPSGLGSDTGELTGECMQVECTVSFTTPKISQVFPPACEHLGNLVIARIGIADSVLDTLPGPRLLLNTHSDVSRFLKPRNPSSHKGTYGHVLAIGGSSSKPGAIAMTGISALKAGAGLTTVVTSQSATSSILAISPELMIEPASELADGTMDPSSFDEHWFYGKTSVAIGPGIGTSARNLELVHKVIQCCPLPLVIDADGLAALKNCTIAPRTAITVLTPHPGEMSRLVNQDTEEIQQNRVQTARQYSTRHQVYLILKGYRTLIASPDGDVVANPTGTPGMATAGSGDILTGILAAFLGQFPEQPVLQVLAAAVYLHGLAGEIACQETGEHGMLATDCLNHLPEAFQSLGT